MLNFVQLKQETFNIKHRLDLHLWIHKWLTVFPLHCKNVFGGQSRPELISSCALWEFVVLQGLLGVETKGTACMLPLLGCWDSAEQVLDGGERLGKGRSTSGRCISGCLAAGVGMSPWSPKVYTPVHITGLNRVVAQSTVNWAVPYLATPCSVWPWLSQFRELWGLGWNELLALGRRVSLSLRGSLSMVIPDVSMSVDCCKMSVVISFLSHLCYWTNCKCVYWYPKALGNGESATKWWHIWQLPQEPHWTD